MKQQILDHFCSELSRSSDHTKKAREYYAEKFLDFVGDKPLSEWNKTLVNEFEAQLRGEGYAAGTIRTVYGIVKRVFDSAKAVYEADRTKAISEVDPANPAAVAELVKAISLPGPNWDVGKRAAPRVSAEDVVKPALTMEEAAQIISVAKDGKLETDEVAFTALASILGLRRGELLRVTPKDIDFQSQTIFVHTEKGGEQRRQYLAREIIPFLQRHDFSLGYSLSKLSQMYHRIELKAGLDHKDGAGFHSWRRLLDTVLRDSCGELYTKIYMRWKLSSSSEMVDVYYTPQSLLEIDRIVQEKHPLLSFWQSAR